MASVLITGGAGFIGSNIAEELCCEHDITILDNFYTGKPENIPKHKRVRFVRGDICNPKTVRTTLKGIQYVLHQAALPSVPRSIKDPNETNRVNVGGTLNVLFESSRAEVERFVYASSSSVYGDSKTLPKKEDMAPNPISPYAVSKLGGEHYCSVFAKSFGLSTVSLRYFNVFGPKQDPASQYAAVIPRFIKRLNGRKKPIIFGDGTQTRDFTYVKNVVLANELAMESKNGAGESLNIASGERHSLNALVRGLNGLLGVRMAPAYGETREGDIKHSLADIAKAGRVLGYKPRWDFEEGLTETVAWYVKKR
jgi:nucleoside-diphosphate-sugar epimerase